MYNFKTNKGLTLIELVIGMAILVFVMSAITPLFAIMLNVTSSGMVKNNIIQEGRWVADLMTKEVSSIDGVNKITVPALNASGNVLTFKLFNSADIITYSYNNNTKQLSRKDQTTTRPMTNAKIVPNKDKQNNDLPIFTRNKDGTSIDIEFNITQEDNKKNVYTETIKTTILPLNNGNDK